MEIRFFEKTETVKNSVGEVNIFTNLFIAKSWSIDGVPQERASLATDEDKATYQSQFEAFEATKAPKEEAPIEPKVGE